MPPLLRNTITILVVIAAILVALFQYTRASVRRIEATFPPSGRFIQLDVGRMRLVELGDSAAPSLVLLHGAFTNLADLRAALGDRLAARYHVVLIDRPGHGWSDRPDGEADASPKQQAALLEQTLRKIGVNRAIFVAHSWSGAVALAYALRYPQQVAGLVLLAPATYPAPPVPAWQDNIVTVLLAYCARTAAAPVLGPLVARTLALPIGKLIFGFVLRSAFAPQEPPSDYAAQTEAELALRPSEFVANAEDIAGLEDFLATQDRQYGTLDMPITIISGTEDQILSPAVHSEALARAVPNGRLIMLPGVGHMVHFAAPERVVSAIDDLANAIPEFVRDAGMRSGSAQRRHAMPR